MNRKQKVAVVVGVVVITLIVLFPPYASPTSTETAEFRWLHPEQPRIAYRWIASEPPHRLAQVERQRTVMVTVDPRGHWSGMLPPPRETITDAEGNVTVRYLDPYVTEELERVELVTIGVPYTVATTVMAIFALCALALTVAAVVVLKERKGVPPIPPPT